MTDNQIEKIKRLKEVRRILGLSQSQMAEKLEMKQPNLSALENARAGKDILNDIHYILSDKLNVNKEWFETGIGDMFFKQKQGNTKSIGEINYPLEVGDTPFIDLGDGQFLMVVELVNEYAYAGYLSGYKDPEYLEDLPKHTIIVDKHHKGQYRAFEVVGDSMDNNTNESIVDGSIATGREIQRHLWSSKFHTHRYKDYIIVSKGEGIITKRVLNQDMTTGTITLHSLNPDKETYPDFEMNLDDIQQMFNIVAVTNKR